MVLPFGVTGLCNRKTESSGLERQLGNLDVACRRLYPIRHQHRARSSLSMSYRYSPTERDQFQLVMCDRPVAEAQRDAASTWWKKYPSVESESRPRSFNPSAQVSMLCVYAYQNAPDPAGSDNSSSPSFASTTKPESECPSASTCF